MDIKEWNDFLSKVRGVASGAVRDGRPEISDGTLREARPRPAAHGGSGRIRTLPALPKDEILISNELQRLPEKLLQRR